MGWLFVFMTKGFIRKEEGIGTFRVKSTLMMSKLDKNAI
jgi:hypothetical protein